MIRTRDFAIFCATLVFFLSAITATVAHDLWGNSGQVATVVEFANGANVQGAVADSRDLNRSANIDRLKAKIAAGEGDSPFGEPVFESVDDIVIDDAPAVTDAEPVDTVTIGTTMDGQSLASNDIWRFVGFNFSEQIGIAVNGNPIYGSRTDGFVLDACGGGDDGSGYKLYLQTDREVSPSCFVN